jgi:hypothetical protein
MRGYEEEEEEEEVEDENGIGANSGGKFFRRSFSWGDNNVGKMGRVSETI